MIIDELKNIKLFGKKLKALEQKITQYSDLIELHEEKISKALYSVKLAEIKNNHNKYIEQHTNETQEYYRLIIDAEAQMLKSDISDNEKNIITMRYFKGLSWKEISFEVDLSNSYCAALHRSAINKLSKVLDG